MSKHKTVFRNILPIVKVVVINIVVLVLFFVLLEGSFRLYNYVVDKPVSVENDDTFGWKPIVTTKVSISRNYCGEVVKKGPVTDPFIRKLPRFPHAPTTVLFIGDSYTHAEQVSDGSAYYDIFEKEGNGKYRVFAAAVGGYGTLQEYMILNKVYNSVKPDIVIWQMCSNDVSNNVYELDNSSFFNNQRPRPYIDPVSQKVEIKNPGFFLFRISTGFNYLFSRVVAYDSKYQWGVLNTLDKLIALSPKDEKRYQQQGIGVVGTIMRQAKKRYPTVQFIGFSVNNRYDADFERQFYDAGCRYWPSFAKYMNAHGNINCLPLDAHWNYHGHQVAGSHIFQLLQQIESSEHIPRNEMNGQ